MNLNMLSSFFLFVLLLPPPLFLSRRSQHASPFSSARLECTLRAIFTAMGGENCYVRNASVMQPLNVLVIARV